MTYLEYTKEYKTTIRRYPDITATYTDTDAKNITLISEEYTKTRAGKWTLKDKNVSKIDFIQYHNIIAPETIRFFKNLGGFEKVTTTYTRHGLIPTESISINPARDFRHVRKFIFD